MMLPTSAHLTESAPILIGLLGGNPEFSKHLENLIPSNCAILDLGEREIELGTLASCDAIIGLLDGNLGVSPTMITSWADAIDHDLPRIILAINTVTGRADFDEAIALSDLHFCSNCESHDCLDACPVEAIKYNDIYNIPLIDQALCVQCGACVAACPYGLIKVQNDGTIIKCDLCSGQPACVKACIPEALVLKKNIKE